MSQPPLIVGLVSDLFFAAPIEHAARAAGFGVQWIGSGEELEPGMQSAPPRARPGEPLAGRGSGFIRRLIEWQPRLVIVELNSSLIPWADWVAALKSSAATRRIPVIGFGPHTDQDLFQRARQAGCDEVLAQGGLAARLPELIARHARQVDGPSLAEGCAAEPSERARLGFALFNQGRFFEAHEELEHAWNDERGPARELYRAVLQTAVAYLQIERGNYNGALKMFLRLRQWIDPLPAECQGLNVARLRAAALRAQAELERLGPERMGEFDRKLFEPLGESR